MDILFKNMDFLVKLWAPFSRRFPSPVPLLATDFISKKSCWTQRVFHTCNFSLILRGSGEFRRAGKTWTIQAPCVLTQWPGEYLEYGPPPGETWDELYLIYDARLRSRFLQSRFIDPALPVWPIEDIDAVRIQVAELKKLVNSAFPETVADQVDRVCERLVLETRLTSHSAKDSPFHQLIAKAQRNPGRIVDFQTWALQHGMSLSTFRRHWGAAFQLPPARFLQQLRMREACRLLAETTLPINAIAHSVGFEDELYFSRRFRKEQKMSPSDYRNAYRMHHLE